MNYPKLNLPECTLKTRINPETGTEEVFDPQRKKYVRLSPEEWVRQNFVHYLIHSLGYPQGRIGNEVPIRVGRMEKRCDTIVYGKTGHPAVIVEYKAPTVALTQKVFDQILRYDFALQVDYLIVSNGLKHYCCHLNRQLNRFEFLPQLPMWSLIEPPQ
ncbi:MAG: type I restriction enzyme HsdR N-terminal domain-containing protein [Bacteroidales bacterium]|nr:type I restriction enzyme HsdR N-terminal domain-containing protein [Bacteroidales bacterium]